LLVKRNFTTSQCFTVAFQRVTLRLEFGIGIKEFLELCLELTVGRWAMALWAMALWAARMFVKFNVTQLRCLFGDTLGGLDD
jgi:hypothetical protein